MGGMTPAGARYVDSPVTVANFRTRLDAEMASQLLAGHGIPFVIQSAEGMLHGPLSPGASILVRPDQADAARAILREAGAVGDGDDA